MSLIPCTGEALLKRDHGLLKSTHLELEITTRRLNKSLLLPGFDNKVVPNRDSGKSLCKEQVALRATSKR